MPTSDIIIVGAGSAGCILAHELRHKAGASLAITLIEPTTTAAPEADQTRPSHWLNLLKSSEDWNLTTEAVNRLAGRPLRWPRGRGLGGSSRINAMIWFPPTESDFRVLAESAGSTVESIEKAFSQVASLVQPENPKWLSHSTSQFLTAAADLPGNEMMYRRMNRNGRRWNPAHLLNDRNIDIVRTSIDRLMFESDRVTGVITAAGEALSCNHQVILCAGAIATPMILMRSGIGPRDILADFNIDVRQHTPGVGSNLQDHLIMPVVFGVKPEHEFKAAASESDLRVWQSVGGGPIASNIAEVGGLFLDGKVQTHVTPTHYLTFPNPQSVPAMTIGVNVTQPKSRGYVRISSEDPNAPPLIQPNYLSSSYDRETTIDGVRWAREIVNRDALADTITNELLPGIKRESDESIAKSISRFSQTLYHPVGTAADLQLPDNLRIADASALTRITVGNPNASVMTLAMCIAQQVLS